MLYDFTNPPGAVSEILVKVAVCVWFQFGRVGAHRYVNVIFSFSSPAAAHRTNTTCLRQVFALAVFFSPLFPYRLVVIFDHNLLCNLCHNGATRVLRSVVFLR